MKPFIFTLVIFGVINVNAQTSDLPSRKFGVRAGGNYSLMNFNKGFPQPATKAPNSWKAGPDLRLLLNLRLNNTFTLQPEYALAIMNGEDKRVNTNYQLSYLSLPVLLRIAATERLAFLAGPQFDLLIHARQEISGVKTNITHDTEERNISIVAGIEVTLPGAFFVDARYVNGFNHVGLGQRSAVKEFKWQGISAGVGVRF